MLNQTQRLQMLEQALKDKAPQTYLKLEAEGKLQAFLEKREGEVMESYYRAYGEVYYQILQENSDKDKMALALAMARTQKMNDVIATWTEFKDPEDY